MASTSSSPHVALSSTLSLPRSCTSHTTNKSENLVEYSYIPKSAQISESSYPLISLYQLYKRPSSFTHSIRTLISTRRPHSKEYIQSSRLDQSALQATSAEQYVTLEIPSELLSNWKREGYTHLHLGGIRLILTLHGRKGLPVTARLAMLDTRFKQYQDAVIGTVLTTLHAGSVLLTFYPNFNLSLQDPNLPTTLKVQVQIQGAEQISSAKIATLHHQLVYRLQNHALDLPTPEHHSDTLMLLAESDQIPTTIQIPRQIPRHELIKLMPLEWISNYEQFHNNTAPIQTSESMFERRPDGTVRMTFKPPPSAPQEPPRLSFPYSSMITAVQTTQEDLPISGFNSEGYPVYLAKQHDHFLWDAPGSGMCDPNCPCWDDWDEDDDYATTRKKKPKKKKPPVSCHHYDPKPPQDPPPPPAPLPFYKKELKWIAKHCKSQTPSPIPLPTPPLTCMMCRENISFMASTSSSPHVALSSTLSLPSIRTLISTRRPHSKEYIQSSRLAQCALQATSAEQYVTLEIPSELFSNWKRKGYTHLHLGGIRLILTLHGRKGLPVTARLPMLDTRFKQYQDAVIGTVLTTLHAGSVLLTFYPNFNLSLQDPNLPTTLKVQVQIQGAEQISSAKIVTLHHQLVYRLQNHALDLPTPEHHSDILMVLAESDQIPTIIQIPRQIPRHELIKLMPLEWISNYEQFHNNTAPIQTSESMFERRKDGTVRMTFKPPPSAPQEPPRLSFTYSSIITAGQTAQEDLPITGFNSEGYPVYPAKQNGHFLWDAPGSGMCDPTCPCWDDWDEDDDYATTRKKKLKKKKSPVSCHHCDPKPPQDPPPPPAPLPFYRKELKWIAKHCKSETPSPIPLPTPPLTCMMFSSTSSDYSSSFPPLDNHTDSQRNVSSTGKPNINSKVEHISLRTEQLETKVDSISAQMQQIHHNLQSRITQLDSELRAMLAQRYYDPEFDQKEREIRRLQPELAQIESEKQRPTLFTTSPPIPSIGPTYHPFASMLSPITQYGPSKLFCMTHTLFRDNPLPPPPKPEPKPKPQPRPVILHPSSISIPGQHSPGHTPASPPVPPPPTESQPPSQSKDKQSMHQFSAHAVDHSPTTDDQNSDSNLAVSDSHTETDTESSVSTSDSEKSYADITRILMAQPDQPTPGQTSHTEPYVDIPSEVEEEMPESSTTNQPPPSQAQTSPPSQKSSNGPWFTFDDLPSHKWRRYRQLQFVDLPEVSSALAVLHDQFLGDPSAVFEAARRDYLNMKCCSLNAKDLDFHYKRMSLLFYKLNGFNEPTLKHVFLASLPDELQPDIQRQLTASNLSLDNISLGKIFQLAKTCLDKMQKEEGL
ncbi:hypothetical protein KPL71_001184 [Citrus sinensis]|uniref:Uncharacterized protein n=1 Tax=Citrus sinensis TaxID=2711 RepID=A0ACB8NVJ6_CITSI|nr:hypothetical protein KPL71_001184 [Citrus sinensis]